jgi:prepilin-type processing-associated H-X9-DG protein
MDAKAWHPRKRDIVVLILCAAFLISALGAVGESGRQRAKEAVCQANLRQLGDAMSLFLGDHDDCYPSPWTWLVKTEAPELGYQRYCRWHDSRYPPDGPVWAYLAKEKIALCPTFAGLAKDSGTRHPLHRASVPVDPQYGYSMNVFLGSKTVGFLGGVVRSSEITRSKAEVFVFAEENMWQRPGCANVLNDTALPGDGREWFGTFHDAPPDDLNGGTVNVVFVDGHVQKVRSGLVVAKDFTADRSTAEYGRFEKYAWPFEKAP